MIDRLKKNLIEKGYHVYVFNTKEEAADYINNQLDQRTIGIGGSVTVSQMNLYDSLSIHNTVYMHDYKINNMSVRDLRLAAARSDIYISSVNAISLNGEIVNIDGTGNRVAAISYGPSDIYLVIGVNKIADTLESAIYRARNIAAPLNARRLNRNTPCAINADRCYNCNSSERICRNLSVLLTAPIGATYHIVLINEELGY